MKAIARHQISNIDIEYSPISGNSPKETLFNAIAFIDVTIPLALGPILIPLLWTKLRLLK